MASIGLNIARDGSHDPSLVRSLGATWVRIVAMSDHDLSDYFRRCRDAGLKILLVLARESGGNYALYRDRYGSLVDAWQIGNEADLVSPSSWTMQPSELAALGRSVRALIPNAVLVCSGLASGHPSWLDGMDLGWADAIAFHPYLKDAPNPDDLEDLPDVPDLLAGYQRFGKPLLVTEWGWWGSDERRGEEEVRDMIAWAGRTDLLEVFFYFCISDSMVPPFGLLGSRGREKPAAKAFREQTALAVHSLWPEVTAEPEPVEQPAELPRGIDVASYQGNPDWAAVARDGYQFAITKLSEGTNYVNPTFARNWAEIKRVGMARGVYHFARPSANTPDAEAAYFLDNLAYYGGALQPGDLVVLDIEDERTHTGDAYGTVARWSLGWLQYVEEVVGFKPLVYTGPWYTSTRGFKDVPELASYGLWLASYQSQMPPPVAPWDTLAIWQFTSSGRVAGIAGDVDLNVFNGPIERLALYGKPSGTAPVPEPAPPAPSRVAVLLAEIRERIAELERIAS